MTISPTPVLRRCLAIVAAPSEVAAVLGRPLDTPWAPCEARPGLDVVMSGIGKANAAGATARFADAARHDFVLSVGVAGSLEADLPVGQVVIGSASVFADEGVETPDGFLDCQAMGFPLGDFSGTAVPASPEIVSWLNAAVGSGLLARIGPIATVSTCSGTDRLASQTRDRTLAIAEGMEGAAVGVVARRLGIAFGELRVISNTTGDRNRQVWDMKLALERLATVIGQLAQALRR
jgi:futalosine hydrolase